MASSSSSTWWRHYIPEMEIKVGMDLAIVEGNEQWIVRVVLLEGEGMFYFRRFYRIKDLFSCGDKGVPSSQEQDERQIFLDEHIHWIPKHKSHVDREVIVKYVPPGSEPSASFGTYWFSHTYAHQFRAFVDFIPSFSAAPTSCLRGDRPLQTLDLYCGCGGLSFITNSGYPNPRIVSTIAVDNDDDSCLSYKINHEDTLVHKLSVDDFLLICQHLDILESQIQAEPSEECNITSARVVQRADEDDVKSISNTILELKVDDYWTSTDMVETYELRHFLNKRRTYGFPVAGDIDLVMGGPPCQDLSTANSRAANLYVLESEKNQQVAHFYNVVEYLQPTYVLMENVPAALEKEDGVYCKFSMLRLLNLGFQTNCGIVYAGHHGAPQVRPRCFIWGAKSGRAALPAFPQPMFNLIKRSFGREAQKIMKECAVTVPEEEQKSSQLFPMVTLGDILGDLPAVPSFSTSEVCQYKGAPNRPLLAYLRRNLPDAQKRWKKAEEIMGPTREKHRNEVNSIINSVASEHSEHPDLPSLLCQTIGTELAISMGQSGEDKLVRDEAALSTTRETRIRMRTLTEKQLYSHTCDIGKQILEAEAEERRALSLSSSCKDLVRGHVSCITSVEYERIKLVPKGDGKGLMDIPGILQNENGICYGSTHCCGATGRVDIGFDTVDGVDERYYAFKGGCESRNYFLPSTELACRSYFFRDKRSSYKRIDRCRPMGTLVGMMKPHMRCTRGSLHPEQDRCLTVLECQRIQGFPDDFCIVASNIKTKQHIKSRYQQIGNAVSPLVAEALGRCLVLAAQGHRSATHVEDVSETSPLKKCVTEAIEAGLKFYSETSNVSELIDLMSESDTDEE